MFNFVSAEACTEWRQSPDLQDFLLQSSDEEDVCSLDLSDPQLDLEVDIMTYFDKNPKNNTRPQREKLYSTISCFFVLIMFKSNQFPLHFKTVLNVVWFSLLCILSL